MNQSNQITSEVSATWWTANGAVESVRWLQPEDGYVRIEIGDSITLSLNGIETIRLLFYLDGYDAGDILGISLKTDGLVAWEEDNKTTIQIGEVMVTIDNITRERLSNCLGQLLRHTETQNVD